MSTAALTTLIARKREHTAHRMRECRLLLRLVITAYYEPLEQVLGMVLSVLDQENPNQVTEQQLIDTMPCSIKCLREALHRLRAHGLIKSKQKEDNAVNKRSSMTGNESKRFTTIPPANIIWYIDTEMLLKVLKFRHSEILNKLSMKPDDEHTIYQCPNPVCQGRMRKYRDDDLAMEQIRTGDFDAFRCPTCKIEENGRMVGTRLVSVSEDTHVLAERQTELKTHFTSQTQSIFAQMDVVAKLMNEEDELATEEERLMSEIEKQGTALPVNLFSTESTPAADKIEVRNNVISLSKDKTTASTVDAAKRSVIASNAGIGAASFVTKTSTVPNLVPATLLPWDARYEVLRSNAPTSVNINADNLSPVSPAVTAPTTETQHANTSAASVIDTHYAEQYRKEMQQQTAMIPPTNSPSVPASENAAMDVMIKVQGVDVSISKLSQQDIEHMTEDELAAYDKIMNEMAV